MSFDIHCSYDPREHVFELMTTSNEFDCLMPGWHLGKYTARGTTTSQLHFPHCGSQCYRHEKIHLEYPISYDKCLALNMNPIHNGSLVQSTLSMLDWLPKQYHKFLLLIDPEHAEKFADTRGCNHRIDLITCGNRPRMEPIYQLPKEEEKILIKFLEKMIKEKKIRPSSRSVGSVILFMPKPNGNRLWLCVDYRHLDGHTKKDKTHLPIMDELSRKMRDCDIITKRT